MRPYTVRDLSCFALAFGLSLHAFKHLDGIGPSEDGLQNPVDLLVRELVRRDILFQHSPVSAETVSALAAGQLGFLLFQLLQVFLTHLQILLGLLVLMLETITLDKTTVLGKDDDFFISRGELEFAQRCRERGLQYQLHRVYNLNEDTGDCSVVVFTADELLRSFELIPVSYKVRRCAV